MNRAVHTKKKPRLLPHSRGETNEKFAYLAQSTARTWEVPGDDHLGLNALSGRPTRDRTSGDAMRPRSTGAATIGV